MANCHNFDHSPTAIMVADVSKMYVLQTWIRNSGMQDGTVHPYLKTVKERKPEFQTTVELFWKSQYRRRGTRLVIHSGRKGGLHRLAGNWVNELSS